VRHFVEHPGGLVRVLGVEREEGVGEEQAPTAYLRVNLVAESVVAAAEQGGVGELVGGGNGWVCQDQPWALLPINRTVGSFVDQPYRRFFCRSPAR
jgi:hypothetical protein